MLVIIIFMLVILYSKRKEQNAPKPERTRHISRNKRRFFRLQLKIGLEQGLGLGIIRKKKHRTDSLCCTPETNTTSYINYTPVKKKKKSTGWARGKCGSFVQRIEQLSCERWEY